MIIKIEEDYELKVIGETDDENYALSEFCKHWPGLIPKRLKLILPADNKIEVEKIKS